MPRFAIDLNTADGRAKVGGRPWRVAPGLVPGEPNEGLTAQLLATPARLADYDDSGWDICDNVRQSLSVGFTFAWYRIAVTLPETIDGVSVAGSRVWFETNFDNYGEVWVNGEIRPRLWQHRRPEHAPPRGNRRGWRTRIPVRHRLPLSERPSGRPARGHLHALRNAGFRVNGQLEPRRAVLR